MNQKDSSHGGAMVDFSFLPTVHSFRRKLGESVLATPGEFSVNSYSRHRTSVNNRRYGRGHGSGLSAHPRGRDLLRQQYLNAKERMPRRKEVCIAILWNNQTDSSCDLRKEEQ